MFLRPAMLSCLLPLLFISTSFALKGPVTTEMLQQMAMDPEVPSATHRDLYNNLVQDSIICADSRKKDGSYTYQKCERYWETGLFPFCIYMVVPSTDKKPGHDAYGCAYAHQLPHECAEHETFYFASESVSLKGKTYHGSMMCCMENYCNAVDEPVFTNIRIKSEDENDGIAAWPFIIAFAIILTGVTPLLQKMLLVRTWESQRRTEEGVFMDESIKGDKEFSEVLDVTIQGMRFDGLRKMQEAARRAVHLAKLGTLSTTNAAKEEEKEINEKNERNGFIVSDTVSVFQKDAEKPTPIVRVIQSRYEHLAQRMIEHGPFEFKFDPVELGDLFDSVAYILEKEPTLLELTTATTDIDVYGNMEGSYGDLFRWFHRNGWPPKRKVLFLGGLTNDNEPFSLETISLIFALKKLMPNHVYILRGASECYPMKVEGHGMTKRVCHCLSDAIQRTCSFLPLAATVYGTVLLSHGGVSPKITKLSQIAKIKRPLNSIPKGSVAADLVFSQASHHTGIVPGSRGRQFTKDYYPEIKVDDERMVELIVRSRNWCLHGYQCINDSILSLWSASGVPKGENYAGACLSITHDFKLNISRMVIPGTYSDASLERLAVFRMMKEEEMRAAKASKRYLNNLSVETLKETKSKVSNMDMKTEAKEVKKDGKKSKRDSKEDKKSKKNSKEAKKGSKESKKNNKEAKKNSKESKKNSKESKKNSKESKKNSKEVKKETKA